MQEVVAQTPNDHQQCEHPVTRIIDRALDDRLNEIGAVRRPKIK